MITIKNGAGAVIRQIKKIADGLDCPNCGSPAFHSVGEEDAECRACDTWYPDFYLTDNPVGYEK